MYMSNVHCTLHKRTFQMLVPSYGHGHGHGLVWHAGLQLPSLPSLVPSDRHCTLPPPLTAPFLHPHTAPFLLPILHPSTSLYCTPPSPLLHPSSSLYCTPPTPQCLLYCSPPCLTAWFLPLGYCMLLTPRNYFFETKTPQKSPKTLKNPKKKLPH